MSKTRRKKHYSRSEREKLREKAQAARTARRLARIPVAAGGPAGQAPGTWRSWRADPEALVDADFPWIGRKKRRRLVTLYRAVIDRRPGLVDHPYASGLSRLKGGPWLRDPASWQPDGRGLTTAFRSFAGHLFGKYPISPLLWDTLLIPGWSADVPREAARFLAAYAGGQSPRKLAGTGILPTPLTRRMCHLLTNPPRSMGFMDMVRRAQVLGYGGTEQLAHALRVVELDGFREDEDYWAGVIHWICRQDVPDRRTIKAIVEYLDECEFYREQVCIRGRTWYSVLRDARRLKREEKRQRAAQGRRRASSEPAPKKLAPIKVTEFAARDWTITRIKTARKLLLEGAAMRHCVATYSGELAAGTLSFWSLARAGKRRLTIEVRTEGMVISEICGKSDRLPRENELHPVKAWARQNGLDPGVARNF